MAQLLNDSGVVNRSLDFEGKHYKLVRTEDSSETELRGVAQAAAARLRDLRGLPHRDHAPEVPVRAQVAAASARRASGALLQVRESTMGAGTRVLAWDKGIDDGETRQRSNPS